MGEFWSWSKYGAAFSCTEMASAGHVYGRMRELEWSGHLDSVDDGIPVPERGGRSRRTYTLSPLGVEALREDLFYKSRGGAK